MDTAADRKELDKVPPRTLLLIVGTTVVTAVFLLLLLYPQYRSMEALRVEKKKIAWSLEEQKQLFPIQALAITASQGDFEPGLTCPEREKFPRGKIQELSALMERTALAAGLVYTGNSLDINSVNMGSGLLAMDLTLDGTLFDFREFLVEVVAIPYVDSIGKITLGSGEGALRISLRIWIAIEKV
jgi:hypothetical protein